MLAKYGIHAGQDVLLYYLESQDGEPVSKLLENLCVQPATISNMINRMAANDLIQKVKDETDLRVTRIFLTEKGKEAAVQVRQVWRELEFQTIAGFSEDDKQLLKNLLKKVLSNFDIENEKMC